MLPIALGLAEHTGLRKRFSKNTAEFSGGSECLNKSVFPMKDARVQTDVKSILKDTSCLGELSEEEVRREDVKMREETHGLEFRLSS